MLVFKCQFFDDIDLLGLGPTHAEVVWDLISTFRKIVREIEKQNVSPKTEVLNAPLMALDESGRDERQLKVVCSEAKRPALNSREFEIALYHVLQRYYSSNDQLTHALSESVGKVYHDLRFRLQQLCSNFSEPSYATKDNKSDQPFSYEQFGKFMVCVFAGEKTKAEAFKALGQNKSIGSRSLSVKTLEKLVNKNLFSLGLVSGRESSRETTKNDDFVVDRLQPLSIRELHFCALGSYIGQQIAREKSILFESAFEQLQLVRKKIVDSMIEITRLDPDDNSSASAFSSLCRQVTFATAIPDAYLFRRESISPTTTSNSTVNRETNEDNLESLSWLDKVVDFDCSKLLPRSRKSPAAFSVVEPIKPGELEKLQAYCQKVVESELADTPKLIAKIQWESQWEQLINAVAAKTNKDSALVMRQHYMLTRGMMEIQMLSAFRFYVDAAPNEIQREQRVLRALTAMGTEIEKMREALKLANPLPRFVQADISFHMAIPMILQKEAKEFLPTTPGEMEKYLSISLLGRDKLRFKCEKARKEIIKEHELILERIAEYFGYLGDAKTLIQKQNIATKGKKQVESVNDLIATKKVAVTLGRHLFKAIHEESRPANSPYQNGKNIAQLQETALLFDCMLSQGFEFNPIDLWERGEIDRLIYLSDCFPPKELALVTGSQENDLRAKADQLRLILAIDQAIRDTRPTEKKQKDIVPLSMAIFVRTKEFIERLVDLELIEKSKLDSVYKNGNYDCKKYVEDFKDGIRSLFHDLKEESFRDNILDHFGDCKSAVREKLHTFLVRNCELETKGKASAIEHILNSIQVFDLHPSIHRQFIIEAGGTVAWHLQGNNLIYTYRQDGNEGVSRVVDTRGDRRFEILELIYSMISDEKLSPDNTAKEFKETMTNNDPSKWVQSAHKLLDDLKPNPKAPQEIPWLTSSRVNKFHIAAILLIMISPFFERHSAQFKKAATYWKFRSEHQEPAESST